MTTPEHVTRREFAAACSAGALACGAAAIVAGGFLFPVRRGASKPLFICLESEMKLDGQREIRDLEGRKVLMLLKENGEILALSTICTHLGCAVYYRPVKKIFECPCHQGFFDGEGNPTAGPPREPLVRYPVEIREGKVFVRFSRDQA